MSTLVKTRKTKFNSIALIFAFALFVFSQEGLALNVDDEIKKVKEKVQTCINETKAEKINGTSNSVGGGFIPVDDRARTACIQGQIEEILKIDSNSECKEACQKKVQTYVDNLRAAWTIPESRSETKLKERCDAKYEQNQDDIKECKRLDMKQARSCFKSQPDEDSFMQSEAMQMAGPLMSMVNGADTLMGVYTALNDKPSCYLNKTDFAAKEDKLETQKKDIEDKLRENIEKAETAQADFAEKIKGWTKEEAEIADRLEAIPVEKEENKDKLENEKVKTKLQADSKYNAVLDQAAELRKEYNKFVDARMVALAKTSEFSIHDTCAERSMKVDPAQQKDQKQPSKAVQAAFSGAFAEGKILATNIQKRYDACLREERAKNTQVVNTFGRELSGIQDKLKRLETVLGQINEEKRLAEQEINKQAAKLAASADAEIRQQARRYQNIQTDKTNAQNLLRNKLEGLNTENKKHQQKLALLGLKLQSFQNKRPPKTINDKSMAEMMDQCGAGFIAMINNYKKECCKGVSYSGSGTSLCNTPYRSFEVAEPKKTKKDRDAEKTEKEENDKGARSTN